MSGPVVIILCGPAFAGKSTLAAMLERDRGFTIVSADRILAERKPHPPYTDDDWAETHRIARERLRQRLSEGQSVVVDDTCCFRFLRDHFRTDAEDAGAQTLLAVLQISDEHVWDRQRRNRETPTRPDLADAILSSHLETFEWPGLDEPHVTLGFDEPPNRWRDSIDAELVRPAD